MKSFSVARRRLSAKFLSKLMWQRRLVFWSGALFVGMASVGFAMLSNAGQRVFLFEEAKIWWLPLLVTPIGFALIRWATRAYAPAAVGSGIPQAMAARDLPTTDERLTLLSPRVLLGKIVLTTLGLATGASVGREGPTVQIGAGVMLQFGIWGGVQREKALILAGSAAGIAGAFNTPLAGIVFAIEEMSKAFEQRTNGLVLYAVIISGLVSLGLVGNYNYFGSSSGSVRDAADWAMVAVCGVVGGLAGGLYSRWMLEGSRAVKRWCAPVGARREVAVAVVCGLAVAAIGVATAGDTFGTGYEQARAVIEGGTTSDTYWFGKFAATLATAVSGIPGGIFAPSLSVGAGLGSWLGTLLHTEQGSLVAVLGMAAYFAGVVQSPMTAFVIIMEMTDSHDNVIPLMIVSMMGYALSRAVAPEPLYRSLADGFLADLGRKNGHSAGRSADDDGEDDEGRAPRSRGSGGASLP
ncbi:MAG: chloride channel protein [Phyllobacteriaceae bacterium]|nr:chloride channel protein [Phyllobacteriaceae bacterium]